MKNTQIKSAKPASREVPQKQKEPENLGDCCFSVDTKQFTAKLKNVVSTCMFGIKSGDKDMDFGDDGTGTGGDSLFIFADEEKQRLVFKYTKFAVFTTATMPAHVYREGVFVIAAAIAMAIAYKGKDVVFTLSENTVTVKSGKSRNQFQVSGSADDIEAAKPQPIKADIELGADFVKSIVQKIMFASTDTALPSFGMPLHLKCKCGRTELIVHDNLCAAMTTLDVKNLDDIDVVLPGSALIRAVQACGSTSVKLGTSDSYFRVSSESMNVYHPIGGYDLFDVMGYMEKEVRHNTPDLLVTLNPNDLYDALTATLSVMKLQSKAPGLVTLNFDADRQLGFVSYHNDIITDSTARFELESVKGKRTKPETDGPRLMQFISSMKGYKSIMMRFYDGRIFITNVDETLCFVIPEK